jgi:hypothetical protein
MNLPMIDWQARLDDSPGVDGAGRQPILLPGHLKKVNNHIFIL